MSALFEVGNTDPRDDTDLGLRVRALNLTELEIDVWEDGDEAGLRIDRDEATKLRDALSNWLADTGPKTPDAAA